MIPVNKFDWECFLFSAASGCLVRPVTMDASEEKKREETDDEDKGSDSSSSSSSSSSSDSSSSDSDSSSSSSSSSSDSDSSSSDSDSDDNDDKEKGSSDKATVEVDTPVEDPNNELRKLFMAKKNEKERRDEEERRRKQREQELSPPSLQPPLHMDSPLTEEEYQKRAKALQLLTAPQVGWYLLMFELQMCLWDQYLYLYCYIA